MLLVLLMGSLVSSRSFSEKPVSTPSFCELYQQYQIEEASQALSEKVFDALYAKMNTGQRLNCPVRMSESSMMFAVIEDVAETGKPEYRNIYQNPVVRKAMWEAATIDIDGWTKNYRARGDRLSRAALQIAIEHLLAPPWSFTRQELGISNKLMDDLYPVL